MKDTPSHLQIDLHKPAKSQSTKAQQLSEKRSTVGAIIEKFNKYKTLTISRSLGLHARSHLLSMISRKVRDQLRPEQGGQVSDQNTC